MRNRRLELLVLGILVGSAAANAVTITVDTTDPGVNPDGLCSLIEAMVNANDDAQTHADCPAGSGADVIELDPGGATYTLVAVDNFTNGANGLPSIATDITINGHGSIIERDPVAPAFRIFHVSASGTATLHGLTIQGGQDSAGGVVDFSALGGA